MELDTETEDSAAAGDVDAGMDNSDGVSSRPKRTIKVNTRLSFVNTLNTRFSMVNIYNTLIDQGAEEEQFGCECWRRGHPGQSAAEESRGRGQDDPGGPGGLRQDQLGPGGGGHGGHQAVGQGRRDTQQVILPLIR